MDKARALVDGNIDEFDGCSCEYYDIGRDLIQLHAAIDRFINSPQRNWECIFSILGSFWQYAKRGFSREEDLMALYDYPGLAIHAQHHRNLICELEYLTDKLIASSSDAIEGHLVDFLRGWSSVHAISYDDNFASYLSQTLSSTKSDSTQ